MLSARQHGIRKARAKELFVFEGLGKQKVDHVRSGDLCAITGMDGFEIGDTVSDLENPEVMERIAVDEPTMSLLFTINTSPFLGRDGEFLTSRHIRERLDAELQKNLAFVSNLPTVKINGTSSAVAFCTYPS